MVATITVTVDSTLMRTAVQVNGLTTDDHRTVYRQDPSGARAPVRSMDPANISGGAGFGYDYEAPFNTPISYHVDNGGTDVASALVTLTAGSPWLRSPLLPALDRPVTLRENPELTRDRPQQLVSVLNRRTPVVRSGTRSSEVGRLRLRTTTDQDAVDLAALLEQSVLLANIPNTRFGSRYIAPGKVVETPVVRFIDDSTISHTAIYDVEFVVVDRPVGGVFGDPTATWQRILDVHPTWQSVKDTYATWLDVLRGPPTDP